MLKKKMKGVMMDSSPSSYPVVDEEARARFFKHQNLMQDYNELFKETEEKRRRIQVAKRRRRILLAEVRFLRQRYEELMDYQSQEQQLARAQTLQTHRDTTTHEKGRRDRETALPNPTPVLDLNQMANDDEEEIEAQNTYEPVRNEKSIVKFPISKGGNGKPPLPPRQKDMKLTVCRDIRKGSSKSGKRKISLQDPVALRV